MMLLRTKVFVRSSRIGGARKSARVAAAFGAAVLLAACAQQLPPRTTVDLMQEPAVLESVVARCARLGDAAQRDAECRNAREAVERLATEQKQSATPAVQSGYERAREMRRQRDERERLQREQQEKVDPYTMPLVTDPASAQSPATAETSTTSS